MKEHEDLSKDHSLNSALRAKGEENRLAAVTAAEPDPQTGGGPGPWMEEATTPSALQSTPPRTQVTEGRRRGGGRTTVVNVHTSTPSKRKLTSVTHDNEEGVITLNDYMRGVETRVGSMQEAALVMARQSHEVLESQRRAAEKEKEIRAEVEEERTALQRQYAAEIAGDALKHF